MVFHDSYAILYYSVAIIGIQEYTEGDALFMLTNDHYIDKKAGMYFS
jgi:hypothetical protein